MQQHLLRINLPPGVRVYPSAFREMLAKIPELPNALFHRDEQGETLNSRPIMRVAGGSGWVGLVANRGAERLLRDAVGPAIMAVSQYTKQACQVQMEDVEFSIRQSDIPTIYWIREMAIKRRSPQARTKDIEEHIRDRTLSSIEAACAQEGFDCPTAEQLGIQTAEVVRQRGMRLQTTTGVTDEWVTLVDARVMIHAQLKGLWFVGNLTSRGYGRIILPRPGMSFTEQTRRGTVLQ